MGSQGDAGQFRTPRHIIDFITEIVNPQKNETVLDPACGTAGFLISTYKHILKQNTKKNLGDGLNASDRKKIGENLNGYDISPDMVKMSLVNMYLHKFTNPKINEYDTLSSEARWNEYYDVILANPPFFSPKGGIMPHNRFGVNSSKAEVLFIDYINEHLKPKGRAGIIVPEGVVFQSNTQAYKQLRKNLINSSLIGIISLPAGVFQPYSGVKTSILILDKNKNKTISDIFYIEVKNDGFSLNTNRNPISKNDLPEVKKIISNFLDGKKIDKKFLVDKETILASEDLKVKPEVFEENQSTQLISMSEVIEVKNGYAFKSVDMTEENKQGFLPVLKIGNVSKQGEIVDGFKYHKFNSEFEKFLIPNNSIVIAMTGATVGKVAINKGQKLLLNQRVGKIEIKNTEKINNNYLFHLLKSEKFYHYCQSNAVGGAQGNISAEEISKFKIPLPSIEIQNQIVEELDGYQKIIDGCRQVVENYKPNFIIKEKWENMKIKDIAKLIYGLGETALDNGDFRFVRITDINQNGLLKESDKKYVNIKQEEKKYILQKEDVLVARTGATYGKCLFFESDEPSVFAGYLIKLDFDKKKILPKYFWVFSQSENFSQQKNKLVVGGGQPQFNANTLGELVVPIPSIDEQKEIIKVVMDEQKIVYGNLNLITQLEFKQKEKINSIWQN